MARVAITGLGLITPLGIGYEENWSALITGASGIGSIRRFDASLLPTQIAGEVVNFTASQWLRPQEIRQLDLFMQFALAGAALAMEHACLLNHSLAPERIGVFVGTGMGGIEKIENTMMAVQSKDLRHGVGPYFVPGMLANLAAGNIAIRYNCQGPCLAHSSACASGAHAVGEAYRAIVHGEVDVMIAGAAEAAITPLSIAGFSSARALSRRNAEPKKASRPFAKDRDGFVLSEGCGILVLEEWNHAKARGAPMLAEVVGYGRTCDAFHITSPSPNGEGAVRCMQMALADAAIKPEAIAYINAHASSTAADRIESEAIRQVFGKHASTYLAVSSTKSMHGHLLGAAGSLELAICALALRTGVLPPTINLDEPDPACDLDYIPHHARKHALEYAMSNSFGFGGTNATLILKSID